jgi:hypothetical protein
VDEVVGQATDSVLPSAAALREGVRRRRAEGGPAEETFAALVGLELRPRRLRDASTLWGALRAAEGSAARDAVWAHPDLLPTTADLDDPMGFAARTREADSIDIESAEFDAALTALLDEPADTDAPEGTDAPVDQAAGDQASDDTDTARDTNDAPGTDEDEPESGRT